MHDFWRNSGYMLLDRRPGPPARLAVTDDFLRAWLMRPEMRPVLGEGREVVPADIARAASLMRRGIWLWLAVAPIVGWALA